MPDFTTGPATLPDVGTLKYNGVTFSPLCETSVEGKVVQDAAVRTTKFMEYTIVVDGYVTLPDGAESVDGIMQTLERLLTAQAGSLVYKGRGFDLVVNTPGGTLRDVAWGPIPELLDFQPLGGGRSAKIVWRVTTRVPQIVSKGGLSPVLQFNEETSVSYGEDNYSMLAIRGTLEIPLTRATQATRTLTSTVDNFRARFMDQIALSIDLTRFRITKREFNISRDKRTLEWNFAAEELPYMGLPKNVSIARGSYDVVPARTGMGLATWNCTLRVTYNVPKNQARRIAWLSYLALLRVRMAASVDGFIPADNAGAQNGGNLALNLLVGPNVAGEVGNAAVAALRRFLGQQNQAVNARPIERKAWLTDFRISEGIYLDSKTVTFSTTWRLNTTFSHILVASGLWRKVSADGGNNWARTMRSITGSQSWLRDELRPNADIIVDFGWTG